MKHPDMVAWEEWLESEEGKRCRAMNLTPHPLNQKFMDNRLQCAFLAGRQSDLTSHNL